jgi:DNA-binding HxlR family transcriptional regulator
MALGTGYQDQDCAIARALEVVGERWTILILRDCFLGVRRFSDLQAHLDISKAVLTERLNSLVESGLLERTGSGHPEYLLTEAGRVPGC